MCLKIGSYKLFGCVTFKYNIIAYSKFKLEQSISALRFLSDLIFNISQFNQKQQKFLFTLKILLLFSQNLRFAVCTQNFCSEK